MGDIRNCTAAAGSPQPSAAELVRMLTQALAENRPFAELWARCEPMLRALLGARAVTLTMAELQIAPAGTVRFALRFGGTTLGEIYFEDAALREPERLVLAESCAFAIAARLYQDSAQHRFEELAFTDGLTGVANRRAFDAALTREWARAARESYDVAILLIDVDYFKSYNDTYGHQAGDQCLRQIATALNACLRRPADVFARYGGEEFVALLPGTGIDGAVAVAENFRRAAAELRLPHSGSSIGCISISVGIATCVPQPATSGEPLIQAADIQLYCAKVAGRNRACSESYESSAQPARRAGASSTHNLPAQLAPFVGRKAELRDVRTLASENRLLTIVGMGGCGKTRIAIAAAEDLSQDFDDGACFVDLSPLRDSSLIVATIAARCGAKTDGLDDLLFFLRARRALLILDNCEHLVRDAADIALSLVRECPQLHVIVTSREPLGLIGETVYNLPLLSLEDGVELYEQRTKAQDRTFTMDLRAQTVVRTLCERLDGVALAIELAASRSAVLGLNAVSNALAEQQTLHTTLDWSYGLLSPAERTAFRALAVFNGGFTLASASAICGSDTNSIVALIRKSLVARDVSAEEGRFRLLESVREYALMRLREAGEFDDLCNRHAQFFLEVARGAEHALLHESQRAVPLLEPELDNFRAALTWSLQERHDIRAGVALATALMLYFSCVMKSEGAVWALRALKCAEEIGDIRAQACLHHHSATWTHDLSQAQLCAHAEKAVELYRTLDEPHGLSESLRILAQLTWWYAPNNRAKASAFAREATDLARTIDDPLQLLSCLCASGLTTDESDSATRAAILEESLALLPPDGDARRLAAVLAWLGELEFCASNYERALEYANRAVEHAQHGGVKEVLAIAYCNVATYAAAAGRWESSISAARRTIEIAQRTHLTEPLTFALQTLAVVLAARGKYEVASRLLGFCDTRCGTVHPQRQADQTEDRLYRRLLANLTHYLGEQTTRREMERGAGMSEQQAVEYALAAIG